MRVGTMFLGKVDALANESVQTKFFILGVPLFPLDSYYVLAEQVSGVQGFRIPLHGKSVLFGYVRIAAWLGALLTGIFAAIDRHGGASLWFMCAVLTSTAVVTTFAMGGLAKEEKLRRLLLKASTGVGAPAAYLPHDLVHDTAERLASEWRAGDHGGETWERAIGAGKATALLHALAEYNHRPDLATAVRAAIARADGAAVA